jgi:hypothetical protein
MDDLNAPATKAEVSALLAPLGGRLVALEGHLVALEGRLNERHDMLRAEMQHIHDALIERMADGETKLLKAFYTFAETNQQRLALI